MCGRERKGRVQSIINHIKDLCFPGKDFKVFKFASSRKRRSVVGESARKTRSSAKEVDADGDKSAEEVGVESEEEGEVESGEEGGGVADETGEASEEVSAGGGGVGAKQGKGRGGGTSRGRRIKKKGLNPKDKGRKDLQSENRGSGHADGTAGEVEEIEEGGAGEQLEAAGEGEDDVVEVVVVSSSDSEFEYEAETKSAASRAGTSNVLFCEQDDDDVDDDDRSLLQSQSFSQSADQVLSSNFQGESACVFARMVE